MLTFRTLFLLALFAGLALEVWLLLRHRRHILAHSDRVPDAFATRIPLADHQRAAAYADDRVRLALWSRGYHALLLLGWTLGGGLALIENLWRESGLSPLLGGLGAILSVLLIGLLLDLPLSLRRTFGIEQRHGFNRTTGARFFADLLLEVALLLALVSPLTLAILWLMAEVGDHWWLPAWLFFILFQLAILWLYPRVIAPLFNRFTPLAEGEMKQRIAGLMERCGFRSRGIYVMDGSKRSSHGNAYFTGLGRNKRIVFFDSLVDRLSPDQMEAVLAHELGHFRLHHIPKRMALGFLASLAAFLLLAWLGQQPWFYQALGVASPSAPMALLLFVMVGPVFSQFLSPIAVAYSRHHEFQADAFAVSQSSGRALIDALVALYRDNATTLTPDPLYSAFHDSHPPAPVRIARIETLLGAQEETA